jgi:hypothetical protein
MYFGEPDEGIVGQGRDFLIIGKVSAKKIKRVAGFLYKGQATQW